MGVGRTQHVLFETTHDAPFGALIQLEWWDWGECGAEVAIGVFEAGGGDSVEIVLHHV